MSDFIQRDLEIEFKRGRLYSESEGCAWGGMQPSELLRCELGEVPTAAGVSTGESRGHRGGGAKKKEGSEMGGTRCQEDDPGRGR